MSNLSLQLISSLIYKSQTKKNDSNHLLRKIILELCDSMHLYIF